MTTPRHDKPLDAILTQDLLRAALRKPPLERTEAIDALEHAAAEHRRAGREKQASQLASVVGFLENCPAVRRTQERLKAARLTQVNPPMAEPDRNFSLGAKRSRNSTRRPSPDVRNPCYLDSDRVVRDPDPGAHC